MTNRLSNVTIIRDSNETVWHKEQWCYFCTVSSVNEGLYIVTANFKVENPPVIVLKAGNYPNDAPWEITEANNPINSRCTIQNAEQNVASNHLSNKDIELCHHGTGVENDNMPVLIMHGHYCCNLSVGKYITTTNCPQNATGIVHWWGVEYLQVHQASIISQLCKSLGWWCQ